MDIQRTEEETVEHMKQWLKENGLAIALGIIIGLSSIVGVRYWFTYQRVQAEEASLIYDKVVSALATQSYIEVIQHGKELQDNYTGTSYAVLATMAMAKASYASGDAAAARSNLTWAMDKAGDEGMKHVARIRLARLLIDAKDYTAAMKLITDQEQGAFVSLYEELRGDILVAQDNISLGLEAYKTALVDAKDNGRRQFIQMKLDNLAADIKPAVSALTEAAKK